MRSDLGWRQQSGTHARRQHGALGEHACERVRVRDRVRVRVRVRVRIRV